MIEGSGTEAVLLTHGSGSRRPENVRIRIRIHNTGFKVIIHILLFRSTRLPQIYCKSLDYLDTKCENLWKCLPRPSTCAIFQLLEDVPVLVPQRSSVYCNYQCCGSGMFFPYLDSLLQVSGSATLD